MWIKSIDLLNVSKNGKLYFAKYFVKYYNPQGCYNNDNNLIYGFNVVLLHEYSKL